MTSSWAISACECIGLTKLTLSDVLRLRVYALGPRVWGAIFPLEVWAEHVTSDSYRRRQANDRARLLNRRVRGQTVIYTGPPSAYTRYVTRLGRVRAWFASVWSASATDTLAAGRP